MPIRSAWRPVYRRRRRVGGLYRRRFRSIMLRRRLPIAGRGRYMRRPTVMRGRGPFWIRRRVFHGRGPYGDDPNLGDLMAAYGRGGIPIPYPDRSRTPPPSDRPLSERDMIAAIESLPSPPRAAPAHEWSFPIPAIPPSAAIPRPNAHDDAAVVPYVVAPAEIDRIADDINMGDERPRRLDRLGMEHESYLDYDPGAAADHAHLPAIGPYRGFRSMFGDIVSRASRARGFGDLWNRVRGYIPRAVGAGLGAIVGQPGLGYNLGASFSQARGWGKYRVRGVRSANQVPMVHGASESFRFCHREYLGDVTTSATANTFSYVKYPVNPGEGTTFPFLSSLAGNFQSYRINGLLFHYKPTSVDSLNSTNTALGKVIMSFQYNPLADAYGSELEQANAMWATVCKPSESINVPVECDPKKTNFATKYVRLGSVPSGEDARLYDWGYLQVSTMGMQGTSVNIGELWVSYDISLFNPTLRMLAGAGIETSHFDLTACSTSNYFGTSRTTRLDKLGITFPTTSKFAFPLGTVGTYMYVYTVFGNSATLGAGISAALTNATSNAIFDAGTHGYKQTPESGATTQTVTFVQCICITNPSAQAVVEFSGSNTLPASCTYANLTITQVCQDMNVNSSSYL